MYVCMTMDVERVSVLEDIKGPSTWEAGKRSVWDYCSLLHENGFPATLFVVPDAASAQGSELREIIDRTEGELGLHLHPQNWERRIRNSEAQEFLGAYGAKEQHQLIAAAMEQCTAGLGRRPKAFRSGHLSANDATFAVLAQLGFTHGSLSQPGRVAPRYRAVWAGACQDVHRAHHSFRLIPGDLDFVELPLTVDRSNKNHWTGVGDLRLEGANAAQITLGIQQELRRQMEEVAVIKHLCLMTHNYVDFTHDERGGGRRDILLAVLQAIKCAAEELGLDVRGVTLATARDEFIKAEAQRKTGHLELQPE